MGKKRTRHISKIFWEFGEVIVIVLIASILFTLSYRISFKRLSDVFFNFSIQLLSVQVILKIFSIKTAHEQKRLSTCERLQKEIDFFKRDCKDKKDYLLDIITQLNNINKTDVDISKLDLSGKRISDLNLSKAEIREAELDNCNFLQVEFEETNFSKSNLFYASFDSCNLKKAKFNLCNLIHSNFSNIQKLQKTDFTHADLVEACFTDIEFEDVIFYGTNLDKAVFKRCSFKNVDFTESKNYNFAQIEDCSFIKCKVNDKILLSR